MASNKLLPLCGIAFVALIALTLGISGSTPESGASAGEVASHYTGNEDREFITSFLFAATVPFLVLFALGLTPLSSGRGTTGARCWGQVANARCDPRGRRDPRHRNDPLRATRQPPPRTRSRRTRCWP